ncbi:LOW QUALITY PROTEIN: coiled-coil domain-containing protein 158 [Leptodactylus fuscus]|uniref:LOW QUALITY PROTEIN: coiled-coil domain-containing protein 158 n=1 Tax=Leptodactylus fuscus TaxID=238119 RepID=UPI003F4E74C2
MTSKDLLALRSELDEQTKEIQKLQKEVERATQNTISQLSISYWEKCYKTRITNNNTANKELSTSSSVRCSPGFFSSAPLQALTFQSSPCTVQTVDPTEISFSKNCGIMQNTLAGTSCPVDIDSKKTTVKDCSLLFKDSQRPLQQVRLTMKEPHYHFPGLQQQVTSGINLKIQELMRERTAEEDARTKDLFRQEEENKLGIRMKELETTNVIQEEMLKQARVYTEHLKERLQKQDQVLKDTQKAILAYHEQANKKIEGNFDLSNLGVIVAQTLQDLSDEPLFLKGKIQATEDHLILMKGELKDKEACLKQFQERYDNLVNEHEQERALLVAETNAVRSHAKNIQAQLESSQEQNMKHAEHIVKLESKVSQLQCDQRNSKKAVKEKVEELKKQLTTANGALEDLQNEYTQCKQEYGSQHLLLNEALKTCETQLSLEKAQNKQLQDREIVNCLTNENLRRELIQQTIEVERLQAAVNVVKEETQKKAEQQLRAIQEKIIILNCTFFQLESMKGALQKTSDELAAKNLCLDHAEKSLVESRKLLAEKEKSLQNVVDELKKLRMYAESKKREVQQMRAEHEKITEMQRDADTLKLLLIEKDNMIVTLREQIKAMTHMIEKQNQKVDFLEVEKSQLLDEVAVLRSEIQDLVLKAEKKEKRIAELEELCTALELEKSKLANSNTKKILAIKKMKKEQEDIMAVLRETRSDLANLAEDYGTLKKEYENQTENKENATTKLKMQLKATIAELEQAKKSVITVEGCDDHAVKIATRMQKKITAKREQIDMLQSRIHFLEEALSSATKDKNILKVERKKLMKECVHEASERFKLSETFEILKTENTTLKGNLTRTEAALEKCLSQLSECQAVIQHLEQETMRLRLQHTLDLQELKGLASDIPGRSLHLKTGRSLGHSTEQSQLQKMHFHDIIKISDDNVVKPLEDVIRLSDSFSPFKEESPLKLRDNSSCTWDHVSKEAITLHTADLEDKYNVNLCHDASSKKHIHKQEIKPRSPVHCLLTARASNIDIDGRMCCPINHHELVLGEPVSGFVRNTYQNLQNSLECLQTISDDLQINKKANTFRLGSGHLIKTSFLVFPEGSTKAERNDRWYASYVSDSGAGSPGISKAVVYATAIAPFYSSPAPQLSNKLHSGELLAFCENRGCSSVVERTLRMSNTFRLGSGHLIKTSFLVFPEGSTKAERNDRWYASYVSDSGAGSPGISKAVVYALLNKVCTGERLTCLESGDTAIAPFYSSPAPQLSNKLHSGELLAFCENRGCSSVVERTLRMCEVPGSIPSISMSFPLLPFSQHFPSREWAFDKDELPRFSRGFHQGREK